jgi:hypothetical protein
MTKLFKLTRTLNEDNFYCFAEDEKTAKKIITKEIFDGKRKTFVINDVTNEKISEDGVKYLSDSDFTGIPERKSFMLNGCMSSMEQHYNNKKRSGTLWYSKFVPGSEELWK